MFSAVSNIFIFLVFLILLAIEYIFSRLLSFSYAAACLVTTSIYIIMIIYQILSKLNEDYTKVRVKVVLNELMDAVDGIPLINKNDKIIITWDIIFKKLVANKDSALYDKIMKINPKTIDRIVNLYPSLLLNDNLELVETKKDSNLSSTVSRDKKASNAKDKELTEEANYNGILFIREIKPFKTAFSNYDSSIYMDVLLVDEYLTEEEKEPGMKYDGFSVVILYKTKSYQVVPPVFVTNRKIDKERWFYHNIENFLKISRRIASREEIQPIIVDEAGLLDYSLNPTSDGDADNLAFNFDCLNDNLLIFSSTGTSREKIKVYCELATSHTNFELVLKHYEKDVYGKLESTELSSIIALGSSYQPLVTILQHMQFVVNNINLVMRNKDLSNIIIN